MSNNCDWTADIGREVKDELGVVLGYCLSTESENYTILPAHISAATTLIECFVEPDCGLENTKLIAHDKCLVIGERQEDQEGQEDHCIRGDQADLLGNEPLKTKGSTPAEYIAAKGK